MRILVFSLIFLTSNCFGQPGEIDVSMTFIDSIEFIVVDSEGDTVTSKNNGSEEFRIYAHRVRGYEGTTPFFYPNEFLPYSQVDSNGIVRERDSMTLIMAIPGYDSTLLRKGAWIVQVFHNGETMRVYIIDLDYGESPLRYLLYYTPGNYYLARSPKMYYQDGRPITHTLIPLDETQPYAWERIFETFDVRKYMGM